MADRTGRRTADATARALIIAKRIAARDDLKARQKIVDFPNRLRYAKRELCIAEQAWRHVAHAGIPRRLVFAHPEILKAIPEASLHYRGIALLSLKRVQEIAGAVETWERNPSAARVSDDKALQVCRLYNAIIGSIILDSAEWTLENGYRNVLATLGISADGSIRNIIGQEAETAIKRRTLDWARTRDLLTGAEAGADGAVWQLTGGVRMIFGSEPDIAFEKNGKVAVVVEVKGGKDPAGALERLGAVKKTFDETPAGCKNFLVAGVVTPTMRARLDEMRMERNFDIDRLLHANADWTEFMNEIFHHALRIAPDNAPSIR